MPRGKALVIRYGEHVGPAEGTIRAHQRVLDQQGYVWFVKLGSRLSASRAEALVREIRQGKRAYVLLVTRSSRVYRWHCCDLLDIAFDPRRTLQYPSTTPACGQPTPAG